MEVNNFYKNLFEDTLGLDVLGLESRFADLVKLINRKTLITFGTLIPMKYLMYLELKDYNNIIEKTQHTLGVEYYLSDPVLDKYDLPILDIDKIDYSNVGNVDPYDPDSTSYYSSVIASRQNITLDSILLGAEYTYNRTLTDTALPWKRYHELRGSRILYLRNYAFMGNVEITIKTRYPNIVSIPEEYREIMLKLAKFDIQIKLWNELKYIQDVVTPSGNLDLRISDWESAEKEREDYLRELRNRTLPDRVGASYFRLL